MSVETLAALIEAGKIGQVACDAFSVAVHAAGYKSRWDRIDFDAHPALKAARDAHHAAGEALHAAYEAHRVSERMARCVDLDVPDGEDRSVLHAAGRTRAGNDISGL